LSAIGILLLLLVVVAWLTAAATAVRSVSRIWLRHYVERKLHGRAGGELYLERPHRLLHAAATGTAIALFLGGAIIAGAYPSGTFALIERVVIGAFVVLVLGQLVPRAVARRWAPRLVPVLLPALRLLDLALTPVMLVGAVVTRVARGRARPASAEESARENIEDLLREGELEGVGERDEIAIITGVVQFGEKTLADVMTPRAEVFALDAATPPPELARRIATSAYSRVPVYRGSLDDVVGMVHAFDVLKAGADATPPLRPVAAALATRHCNEQLFDMLRRNQHLAVVRDDAGHTLGIVTLEDLLEELVGDIRDEHDEPRPAAPAAVTAGANGAAAGRAPAP
jgi:putative hemolysin